MPPVEQQKQSGTKASASPAYLSGREAGRHLISAGLNPHPDGSIDHALWEQGRNSVLLEDIERAQGIVMPCLHAAGGCWCGGRGLCKDVA